MGARGRGRGRGRCLDIRLTKNTIYEVPDGQETYLTQHSHSGHAGSENGFHFRRSHFACCSQFFDPQGVPFRYVSFRFVSFRSFRFIFFG